jgi:drug/metabolite transporter (DMT)-like permease
VRAYVYLLLVVFLWGSANVAVKAVLPDFNPAVLVFWRHLVAALVLLAALCGTRRFAWLRPHEWPAVFTLGFFGVFLYQMLQTTGLVLTTATNSGWIGSLAPVFIALFSFTFRENSRRGARYSELPWPLPGPWD